MTVEDAVDDCEQVEPLPPWQITQSRRSVTSLQELCCGILARHLHQLESLDDLPDHLASLIRNAIQQDRRLLNDEGLRVWVEAVVANGQTRNISLRWSSNVTDHGLTVLASMGHWAAALETLDLAFCDSITDAGVQALAPTLQQLRALVLTGCTRCGDGACVAIGRNVATLERLEAEL